MKPEVDGDETNHPIRSAAVPAQPEGQDTSEKKS
jgi:hypothetical protein